MTAHRRTIGYKVQNQIEPKLKAQNSFNYAFYHGTTVVLFITVSRKSVKYFQALAQKVTCAPYQDVSSHHSEAESKLSLG